MLDVPQSCGPVLAPGSYPPAVRVEGESPDLVLALVPRAVYGFYADAPERVFGLSRLTDQQLGGMTMAAEQSVVFFAVFAYWFLRFLAEQEELEE
mgnify:CR=1 FL=1